MVLDRKRCSAGSQPFKKGYAHAVGVSDVWDDEVGLKGF